MPHNDSDQHSHHRGDQPRRTTEPRTGAGSWPQVLDTLHEAGTQAGADAADWWAQDTVGARASGDVAATARMILAGIDDGDPRILDALPALDLSGLWADAPNEAELYADTAPDGAPEWEVLDAEHRKEAIDAFRDGYDTGARDRVVEQSHTALPDQSGDGTVRRDPRRRAA